MSMCKCKKSNPRNPRPCGCMSNPRRNPGTKQPADQYQFAKWREAAKQMTDSELLYVIKDARQAAEAMRSHDPVAEGWYEDEAFTMADELRHRRERAAGKRRNPAKRRNPDVEYGSEDYKIGLFQGAVEKGKAPPPPSTSKELRSGYTAGARVAKAKPAAVQRALGVYSATRDHARAGDELRDATLGMATTANPSADLKGLPKDRFHKLGAVALYGRSFSTAGKKYTVEGVKVSPHEAEAYLKIYAQVGDKGKQKLRSMPLRDALDVCYSAVMRRSIPIGMSKTRNPMSAAARKHLAHEKSEEKTFATMMSKLPVGVTLKAGKHRVRKLAKGYVVVDGERLTEAQAAARIHRGK